MKSHPSPVLEPWDEHNQALAQNVHPADWVNPVPRSDYQLVVIGAGTAGLVTAAGAAGLGARVALIERDLMGGDCLNVGCVPSKSLIHSARLAASFKSALREGMSKGEYPTVDFAAVMERMRKLRGGISPHDSARRFSELGVDVFLGQASFTDQNRIVVTADDSSKTELNFRKAVITTGARAAAPDIPGLDSVRYLTNETLFSLTELPRRLGIIGAGPIGAEMAQTFARLGSEVFLFDRSGNLLPRDDPEAGSILKEVFHREGIRLHLRFQEMQIRQSDQNTIVIRVKSDGQTQDIEVDELLVAVGRAPNVEGLNLEAVGVRFDQNGIQVDDALQTTNTRIFAAGDVCSKFKFTHAADFQARIVIQNALFALGPLGKKSTRNLLIPWATYTSPEVAQVGITAEQAQQQGIAIDTYFQKMSQVDRAILDDQTYGFVKVHTKKGSDQILGATIVAEHAGDLISELTLAMQAGVGLSRMASIIHPYPTQADAIRKLGDQFNRTRLTPLNRWILNTLKRINVGK